MEGEAAPSPEDEAELLVHYGIDRRGAPPLAVPPRERAPGAASQNGAVTRSEEELQVRTVRRPRTRVCLRKYVVTERVTTTVPVRHEEVRLEREPITDADAGLVPPEPTSSDDAHDVVVHEEHLVIEKRVVPTERVRMRKETIIEDRPSPTNSARNRSTMRLSRLGPRFADGWAHDTSSARRRELDRSGRDRSRARRLDRRDVHAGR